MQAVCERVACSTSFHVDASVLAPTGASSRQHTMLISLFATWCICALHDLQLCIARRRARSCNLALAALIAPCVVPRPAQDLLSARLPPQQLSAFSLTESGKHCCCRRPLHTDLATAEANSASAESVRLERRSVMAAADDPLPPPPQLGLRGRHGRQLGPDLLEASFSRLNAQQLAAAELTCHHWRAFVFKFVCDHLQRLKKNNLN